MVPLLFIFLMSAFAENLEDIWEKNDLKKWNFNEFLMIILRRKKES